MANLTLAIDDDLLRVARIKAVQQGTSVNEICREAITRFAAPELDPDDFMTQLRALAERVPKATDGAPAWPGREALYEQAMTERMPTLWATLPRADADADASADAEMRAVAGPVADPVAAPGAAQTRAVGKRRQRGGAASGVTAPKAQR
jgi:hypothetical protein